MKPKTDCLWPLSITLLTALLAGCGDGGIVGTGTGDDASSGTIADGAAPAIDASTPSSATMDKSSAAQSICQALPATLAASIAATSVTTAATLQSERTDGFDCGWRIATATGTAEITVGFHSDPAFAQAVAANASGQWSQPDPAVLGNGYRHIDAGGCRQGIAAPADNGRMVTVSYENRQACASGTDRLVGIDDFNRLAEKAVEVWGQRP